MSRLRRVLTLARGLRRPNPEGLTPMQVGDLVRRAERFPEDVPDPKRMTTAQIEAAIEAVQWRRARLGGTR